MSDYIQNTLKAYEDTAKYEGSTVNLIATPELNELIELSGSGIILDAGCAFGRDTRYMRGRGVGVVSVDMSPALIARATQFFPEGDYSVQDIRKLAFEDNTFSGIWCNATLLHLNDHDMTEALREFLRVLKPGGTLAASVKKGEGSSVFVEGFSSNDERFFNFKTTETMSEILTTAGFTVAKAYYYNERDRYGTDKRDLEWLQVFATKPE
jgi:SAM-dependent methyltransferase